MTYSRIDELKNEIAEAAATIARKQAELERLEKEAAEIKVGDLVVYMGAPPWVVDRGTVGTATQIERPDDDGWVVATDVAPVTVSLYHVRKADYVTDREAITKYLLSKAYKEGFKVGATLAITPKICRSYGAGYLIEDIRAIFPADRFIPSQGYHVEAITSEQKNGKPFVAIRFDGLAYSPASHYTASSVPAITVTVEGKAYVADFDKYRDCVTFGCAIIENRHLRRAHDFLRPIMVYSSGCLSNRTIEAVQIGKGLFTAPILKAIVGELDRRAAAK